MPPKGVAVPEADRRVLEAELSTLAQELKRLRERPETAALLPDVEIFYRAVRRRLPLRRVLRRRRHPQGRASCWPSGASGRRAAGQRQEPLAGAARPDGARLRVGDSTARCSPTACTLPDGFRPRDGRRWRLDVWFHGRGEKLSEVNFLRRWWWPASRGEFVRPERPRCCSPTAATATAASWRARSTSTRRWPICKRRFPIDEDRIVIRGFSLGGHSAWHLGAHFASRLGGGGPGRRFLGVGGVPEGVRQGEAGADLVGGRSCGSCTTPPPTPRTSATCRWSPTAARRTSRSRPPT